MCEEEKSEWRWQGKETWKVSSTDRIVHHYGREMFCVTEEAIIRNVRASFWRAYRFARYHNAPILRSLYIAWGLRNE